MKVLNCEQRSQEWYSARLGIITASVMSQVLAKGAGKTRESLMYKLAGERITGKPAVSFSNEVMENGAACEPVALELYKATTGNDVKLCGFITNDEGNVGYSPDAIGDVLVEIKVRQPHIQIETIVNDKVPSSNYAQIQCGLWVTGLSCLDYVSYSEGMPLFIKTIYPDHDYFELMDKEVKQFYKDMDEIISKVMS